MSRTKAILLAAGLGTRLRPLTYHITKCLVPIAGRPLLDYWVEQLVAAGVKEILINTHHLAEQVRAYIEQVNAQGQVRIVETYEPVLLGSAGTLAAHPQFADDADQVLIVYADNFSDVNLRELLAFHHQHPDPATMLLFHAPNPRACGIAELDEQQRIIGFQEKPPQPTSDLANAGVYIFDADLYRQIAAKRAFDLGFEILPTLVGQMRGWIWHGYYRDMGTYENYLQAQREVVEWWQRAGKLQDPPHYPLSTIHYPLATSRPAVFLDRDGTLIESVHYLSRPEQVKLVPGGGEAVRQLRAAGFACILVTNQSPIGQGLITEADLVEIHKVLFEQLAQHETTLDGIYYSTQATQIKDRTVVEFYDRKPGPGLLFQAAQELHLDLHRSWMVGDMISDLLAGYHAHCQGLIFVASGKGLEGEALPPYLSAHQVPDLPAAAQLILNLTTTSGVHSPHGH